MHRIGEALLHFEGGETLILKIAKPGDLLGLSALISGYPHEVTAVTIEPVQIKSVRNVEFIMFLRG
jgi:CRP/FNR family cyclic AMP-dependent transcriptional regulator